LPPRRRLAHRQFVNPNNASHRTPEQARQEIADKKIAATDWIDDSSGAVGHLYDMKTTPDMYVIDKNGVLVYQGAMDNQPDPVHDPRTARNYVREAWAPLLVGKTGGCQPDEALRLRREIRRLNRFK